MAHSTASPPAPPIWLKQADCKLADFAAHIDRTTSLADYPQAQAVVENVLFYDAGAIQSILAEGDAATRALQAEWQAALTDGPGVLLFRGGFADGAVVEAATAHFSAMIAEERAAGQNGGDHFGTNDRVWNALEKLCLRDPEVFARYYGNDIIALVSEAWLGPGYQITSQINQVNPGGKAQVPHRDYHLGLQTRVAMERLPVMVHRLSPMLTLQGAVAQSDMPLESGPTLYLPYSQTYLSGYLATELPEFRAYFKAHRRQVPLQKGDMVFFNPAVFHAAGSNHTPDIRRMANLLQVSSAYGRAMESVDRGRMSAALYETLARMLESSSLTSREVGNVIAACADGYSFPTNLDRDPPRYGLAPETQQALFHRALAGKWPVSEFKVAVEHQVSKRIA